MTTHASLVDTQVHECKQISVAVTGDAGKVVTPSASVAGTGTLRNLEETEILHVVDVLTVQFSDVTVGGSVYVAAPYAGTITKFYTCIAGAISTADETLRLRIGGVAVTGSDITITASGSAAGDVDSNSPTALNTVTAGQAIQVQTDGNSTGGTSCVCTILVKRS